MGVLIFFVILGNASAQSCSIGNENEDWGDGFEDAEIINAACLPFTIEGRIDSEEDIDVFKLDMSFALGDSLYVEMPAVNEGAIGLFYPGEESLLINDARNIYKGRQGPFIDLSFMESYPYLYLVATTTSGTSDPAGEYSLSISRSSGEIPEPNPDVVFLNFDGAEDVAFGGRREMDIPPLEESWLADEYPGRLEEIKEIIKSKMIEDYCDYNVEIVTSDERESIDTDTIIHFGGYDPGLLGVAEGVDEFNGKYSQKAIVFIETFEAFLPMNPTYEEIAQVIANVGGHEFGHLAGLIHTSNSNEIMDITTSNSQMLRDQIFMSSPIHSTVFPIGKQDSSNYLSLSLGVDSFCFSSGFDRTFKRSSVHEKEYPYWKDEIYQDGPQILNGVLNP